MIIILDKIFICEYMNKNINSKIFEQGHRNISSDHEIVILTRQKSKEISNKIKQCHYTPKNIRAKVQKFMESRLRQYYIIL